MAQNIIGTNLLTKFHEDRKINVASRVLTRKNAPPAGSHVFQPTGIIFELFHEDRTVNVASRVLTRFYYSHIRKNAPPLGSHVFQAKVTIFELIQNITGTNLLSKFNEDWKINVASRVLTRKNAPPPGGHVFQPTGIIFDPIQDIIGMNLLTKFYEDQKINVASRVKNAPPLGSHVFQANVTIFELIQYIMQMLTPHNAQWTTDKKRSQKLTMSTLCSGELKQRRTDDATRKIKSMVGIHFTSLIAPTVEQCNGTARSQLPHFHDDWAKNVISRVFTSFFYYINIRKLPPGSHVIQLTRTIFELNSHIKETNVLTKFHENWTKIFHDDWAKNVISRKTAPGSHVIQLTRTIFELNSHIKETHVLTKFHENWTKIVTSRVFTCFHYLHIKKNALPTGGHVFSLIWTIFELVRDINKTNVLTNFHDLAKFVTSRVFTRKTAPPTGGHVLTNFHDDWAKIVTFRVLTSHVIQLTGTIFEVNSHIKETNVLTKFHENWAKNVISRVEKCPARTNFHDDWAKIVTCRVFTRKTAPPTGGHVFQRTGTTFKLDQHIIKANILTNFELYRDIIGTKLLTKFHEDRT
ncbi:hypothetical protein DPMN_114243 [Dreissena polymorpha]|uniref:Uncharacterized protein n=1 Tax=Dreissena polymorpha TaxID=45954 RepID=A0A9D4KJ15_DREPO|nr:hypothetical protein DPMN_114243 [Dreissena polymorpha]